MTGSIHAKNCSIYPFVSIQYRFVPDGRTNTRRDGDSIHCASIALRGNNCTYAVINEACAVIPVISRHFTRILHLSDKCASTLELMIEGCTFGTFSVAVKWFIAAARTRINLLTG